MAEVDYSIKDVENLVQVDGVVKSVEVTRLTAPGENYLSLVLRVNFEVEKDGATKTVSTVAKRFPFGNKNFYDFYSQTMTNEIKWYTEIVPLIKNFAKEHAIEGLDFYPECCGARYSFDPEKKVADRDACLLLGNLIPDGFRNEDRYKGFDLITAKTIIRKLALFHSVPLAMKFKEPESYKIIEKYLDECSPRYPVPPREERSPDPDLTTESRNQEDHVLDVMIKMPECSEYVDKLKALLSKPKGPMTWHPPGIEPWTTILHNDFWVNNMMIKSREGEEPLVKIVDFQVLTLGSYAKDILFFLLTSVENEVTTKYIDDLLRYYYEEFTSVLSKANVDLELSYTAFLKEIRRVSLETEFCHILFFTTVVFGEKNPTLDPSLGEFDPFKDMIAKVHNMNQHQRDKLVLLANEAGSRNWL